VNVSLCVEGRPCQRCAKHWPSGTVGREEGADEGGGEEVAVRRVHWMISSARARSDGGMVRPIAFAVLRLTTSTYPLCSSKPQMLWSLGFCSADQTPVRYRVHSDGLL
jgi:hypothetical protein